MTIYLGHDDMKTCTETGKPIVEISHSGLQTFKSCPRKFAYRKVLINADQRDFSGIAANVGTAMHEGIQEAFRSRDLDKAIEALALHHPIELPKGTDASVYSIESSIITLREALTDEIMDYELVSVERNGETVDGIEVKFLVVIDLGPDCPVIFHLRGYIDLILKHPFNGVIAPIDIKTMTPNAFAQAYNKYRQDTQITSYGMPINALLGQFDEFQAGIFAVSMSDYNPQTKLHPYKRRIGDVEDYQFDLLDSCQRIARYYQLQHFPRNSSGCVAFGRPCKFLEHCHLRTMEEMQDRINPSRKVIHSGRPEAPPMITLRVEGDML